ncbi:hypothetical protein GH714_011666 [Hevea brasiliensis]|uniref:ABC-2 type transporter transmembrane domain-containing protein n=1 Tax=Hevea brasiliensis TaxID=3981 RepID=A0A6A6N2N9_HEVBR|nr:hypothetical protein GH714_011666 [Hevea brasiliensis]
MDSLNDDQESMTALEVETMNPLQPTTRRGEGGAGGDGCGVSDGVFLTWEDLWAYVTQDETLITTLTVGEAVYYSAQLQLPDSMPKSEKKDLEQGNGKAMSTEEAITTLIKSYKSSINYQQVQRLVHEIYKQDRGSLLMFISTFLTFMTIGGFPSFVEDMKVFERERLNGHYGAAAFVLGNTFSSIPYLLLVSLIPGAITYYLPGLHRGSGHFLYFIIALFSCMMLVESLMMTVASIVPNFLMGIITGSGIQAIMSLGGGLFRLPNDLPGPFWKYPMYYILSIGMVVLYKLLFLVIIKTTEKAVISEEESTTTNEVPEASTQTFPPNNNGGEVAAEVIKILEVQRIA